MASFRCYDNSDVIATLIIYAQTWEVLTLKNYIEPPLSRIAHDNLVNNDDATMYNNDENLSYSEFDDLHYFKKP